jgi:hypothetical protein
VAERTPADGAAGGKPPSARAARAALDGQLTGVLRGRTTVWVFLTWWDSGATQRLLGVLADADDPRGRDAVERCRAAAEEHRARRIDDEELLDLLVLAREALRG